MISTFYFSDRKQAGIALGERLRKVPLRNPIVIALPRGGVPVAFEVAKALEAPLDVLIVRKLGAPNNEELGIGAVSEDNFYWIDHMISRKVGVTQEEIVKILRREEAEVARRVQQYRKGKSLPSLRGRSVVVVDDGLATGVTARVACSYLKRKKVEEVILAIPVCASETATSLRHEADQVICLFEPDVFFSVSQFYQTFNQTSDEEVLQILKKSEELGHEAA